MKTLSLFKTKFRLVSCKSITVGLLVFSQLGIVLPTLAKGREISPETHTLLSLINTQDRVSTLKNIQLLPKSPDSIGANALNSALVTIAINEYLITTSGGPVGNRNYWKNARIPVALMYIDFNNYFALRFNTDVIPTPSNRGTIYTTTLPDGTVVVARPFSNSPPYFAPTLEIQRTGGPYKVRYLPPKQCLALSENLVKRVLDCY